MFGNSMLAVWPQYYIIDRGETYGSSFYQWRQLNFEDVGFFGQDWAPTKKGRERIQSLLWNRAIRFSEDEVDELPQKTYRTINYELTSEQRRDYDDLLDKLNYDGPVINKHMAFRQICSGFIKVEDKLYNANPKLDHLIEIIEQAVEQSKIVVFHEFIKEGMLIEDKLKKLKIGYCTLNGRVYNKHEQIISFQNDEKKRVMIAHPLSGGSSINLVSAAYCAFFSNGGSVIARRQCEKRIHRSGQKSQRVFYYDFVAKHTIESTMLKNLNNGIDSLDRIVDGKSLRKALMGVL
jgi:SNF2 family DNA or RNA helicase